MLEREKQQEGNVPSSHISNRSSSPIGSQPYECTWGGAPSLLSAQDAVETDPKHYFVISENDQVRILKVHYCPHIKELCKRPSEEENRKPMAIEKTLIDQLLADYKKPEDITGQH